MKDDQEIFLVFRVYGPDEERPDHAKDGKYHMFGWTSSKKILKAFLKQRSEDKYVVKETDLYEIGEAYSENHLKESKMLDIATLDSARTGEKVKLISTEDEIDWATAKIRQMFEEACSITWITHNTSTKRDIQHFVNLVNNLKNKYADALHYLGYRPQEIEDLDGNMDGYSYGDDGPRDWFEDPESPHRLRVDPDETDVSKYIIYSIESMVKVLREDL